MKENAEKARALDEMEIAKQLKDATEQMFRLKFQMSMGQMDGVKKFRSLRKERARMLTVLRERRDGAAIVPRKTARGKSVAKPAVQSSAKTVAAKSKAAPAAPKSRNLGQVKVKPTSAPKAAKINTPRKSGKG